MDFHAAKPASATTDTAALTSDVLADPRLARAAFCQVTKLQLCTGWIYADDGAQVSGKAAATATRSTKMTMPRVLLRNGLK